MGWSIGYDKNHKRDIGYGVPAICDHPSCDEVIDRGLGYVCGGDPYGGDYGCGLHFCSEDLYMTFVEDEVVVQLCVQCLNDLRPFEPKEDVTEWIEWKLTDPSWQEWRDQNPEDVAELITTLTERQ